MSGEFVQRYGEPSWVTRPDSEQEETWILSPADCGKSYEELELERRNVIITAKPSVAWLFGNPLSVLAGQNSTVEVVVDSTSWHLHRALLISHSALFKSALSDHSKGKIILTDYLSYRPNAGTFTMFVQWFYTSTFNALHPEDLFNAYIFGSKLGAVCFLNQVIHKAHDMNLVFCVIPAYVARAILHLHLRSGLRRLVVDLIALGFLRQELDVNSAEWREALSVNDAWSEVMSSMARQQTQTWKSSRPEEYYEIASDVTLSSAVGVKYLRESHQRWQTQRLRSLIAICRELGGRPSTEARYSS